MSLITHTDELLKEISAFETAPFVAIDTEFHRETSFWPKLCLIQMAIPEKVLLLDPLSPNLDLSAFFQLMHNPKIMKVFHAGRQDLEIIYHLSHKLPTPIFDTQVAAMVCGFGDHASYDQLVQKITGKSLNKMSRLSNWMHRPLAEKQIKYACNDVVYLCQIYTTLLKKLQKTNRVHWTEEEMNLLTSEDTYIHRPEDAWKRIKHRAKKPYELAIIQSLSAWRETEAQNRDIPRNHILKDETIVEIATLQTNRLDKLKHLRSFPKGLAHHKDKQKILTAIDHALSCPEDQLPKIPENKNTSKKIGASLEILRLFLKITAEQEQVASRLIATTEDLMAIAYDGEKAETPLLTGWRYKIFGEKALEMQAGALGITLKNKKVKIFKINNP